ncbi:MAG: type II CAAX prenyl endopeptidase Rce1 family protein [Betaproteobacteria bacterium]
MTGIVYLSLALSFVTRMLADVNRSSKESADVGADGTIDGIPLLGTALLIIGWAVYGRDPLLATGLCVRELAGCPWWHMCALWATAFVMSRLVQAYLFRPIMRALVDSGAINPGGAYLALVHSGFVRAALVGAAMTFSQTFAEEFAFRGLALSGAAAMLRSLGVPAEWAAAAAVASSSLAFGLLHFIPMRMATRGKSAFLLWYALVVPSSLGAGFCILNGMAGSLWPGWLVHWWLNYAGLMWSKAERRWERAAVIPGRGEA